MIKLKDYRKASLKELELVNVNRTILKCVVALMEVDGHPKIKDLQLVLRSVSRFYENEIKKERKNG